MKKIPVVLGLLTFWLSMVSCGDPTSLDEGEFAGKAAFSELRGMSVEKKMESSNAGFELKGIATDVKIKFHADSLLPNCSLDGTRISGGINIWPKAPATSVSCQLKNGDSSEMVQVTAGDIYAKDGEVVLTLNIFRDVVSGSPLKYEFHGKRKGWF